MTDHALDETANKTLPSTQRLMLLLAVVIGLAVINYFVGETSADSTVMMMGLGVFYIVQVTFISLFCGGSSDPPWLKQVTFAWILALIDAKLVTRMPTLNVETESLVLVGLFAAQFGLLTTWLVMGSAHFVMRIAMTVPLLVCMGLLFFDTEWAVLFLCLVMPLFFVLAILRAFRFRLHKQHVLDGSPVGTSRQFSLFDAMSLMTVLAVIMGGLKSQEEFLTSLVNTIGSNGMPTGLIIVLGFTSAIAAVFACWAALGSGKPVLRYGVLTLVVAGLGVGVSLWACHITENLKVNRIRTVTYQQHVALRELKAFASGEWLWLGWYVSSGLLLVASLIFLRAQGLRFARINRA